jgi:signal transduction histidine kinase
VLQPALAERRDLPRGPDGSSFVPGLVHELRNFVFGLSGSLEALRARFGAQPEIARYETVMQASLDRLNAFLGELRDYGDPQPPAWAEGSIANLLREAVEHHRPRALAEGAELRLELGEPLPPVRADTEGLRMAFVRLIGVALGHPAAGGRVTVQAEPGLLAGAPVITGYVQGSRLELNGLDPGRLFEPFYFRASGFGRLSLPVARRVLESHGGSLAAAPGPGGGVRMSFRLPALARPTELPSQPPR